MKRPRSIEKIDADILEAKRALHYWQSQLPLVQPFKDRRSKERTKRTTAFIAHWERRLESFQRERKIVTELCPI